MAISEDEYLSEINEYMMSKSQFIELVLQVWRHYLKDSSQIIEEKFDRIEEKYDETIQELSKNDLLALLELLGFNIKLAFICPSKLPQFLLSEYGNPYKIEIESPTPKDIDEFFTRVHKTFDVMTKENVKKLLLSCNNEMIPFLRYVVKQNQA